MILDNESTRIRKEVMRRIIGLYFEHRLPEGLARIPLEMRPRGHDPSRCCIYKDRAILRYRCMAVLGFRVEEETDDPLPLSEYARRALARESISGPPLTIIEEACSSCVLVNYFITDACRGCLARPCLGTCAKKAIRFESGRASIDHKVCVNCGRCQETCPYHAIVYVPIPCLESCPADALFADETGKKHINYDKCIYCGRCMRSCPFGAVMERSELIDVLQRLAAPAPVVAMVAPAIVGQFRTDLDRIAGAIRALGFADVVEVALGADETARREAAELEERLRQGRPLMTTSCCPAYFEAVRKHIPELEPFVSATRSPMYYTAKLVKERNPEAVTVFIGPCVAKRAEALPEPLVDYVLTFEELEALLTARNLDVKTCAPAAMAAPATAFGRGFPLGGGVAQAVRAALQDPTGITIERVEGLDRKSLKALKSVPGKCASNLLEVMACEGGCVAGPAVIENPKSGAQRVLAFTRPPT